MTENDENTGVTREQMQQSTRNFMRLIESIEAQAGMSRPDVLETCLCAVATLLAADLGREKAAQLFRQAADKIDSSGPGLQ